MAPTINSLMQQIGSLNLQIEKAEGGDLRQPRRGAGRPAAAGPASLSQLIGTTSVQMPDGTVSVYCGGEYLVSGGIARQSSRQSDRPRHDRREPADCRAPIRR